MDDTDLAPSPSTPDTVAPLAAGLFLLLSVEGVLIVLTRQGLDGLLLVALGLLLVRPLWRRQPWACWTAAFVAPALAMWFLVWVIQGADDDPGDASTYGAMGGLLFLAITVFLSTGLVHARYRAARPRGDWYEDPVDRGRWRYWDGKRWSEHTAPK